MGNYQWDCIRPCTETIQGKLQGRVIAGYSLFHSTQTPALCRATKSKVCSDEGSNEINAILCPCLYLVLLSCSDHLNHSSDDEILSVALRKYVLLPEYL